MKLDRLHDLATEWRERAETLRSFGAADQAAAVERCAEQLEERLGEWWTEPLSIEEAAEDLGVSYDAVQKRLRRRAYSNVGRAGSPAVRRCDLHGDRPVESSAPTGVVEILDDVLG